MDKPAPTEHPVHELVARRWSPRAFSPAPVPRDTLLALFEAARWAPSSGNEQPWRFLVLSREADPSAFAAQVQNLDDGNRRWAGGAPVLVFAIARRVRGPSAKPNAHARYDLGQAVAWLTVEATSRGLFVHQMAGFDPESVCAVADGIPEEYEVLTALVLGYPGDLTGLPEDLQTREQAARQRRPQSELVFGPRWGEALALP
jgi:nitroreductase